MGETGVPFGADDRGLQLHRGSAAGAEDPLRLDGELERPPLSPDGNLLRGRNNFV